MTEGIYKLHGCFNIGVEFYVRSVHVADWGSSQLPRSKQSAQGLGMRLYLYTVSRNIKEGCRQAAD